MRISILLFILSSVGFSFAQKADTIAIHQHLKALTLTEEYRNFEHVGQLNRTAEYIKKHFEKFADTTYFQTYQIGQQTYKNVIAVFNPTGEETVVVGAHYDVCGNQQGADDNASGVTGLLELARMLDSTKLNDRAELVAFTLEEPPYFRTEYMGSYIHAKSLKDSQRKVKGMVVLEMIGYFSDVKGSQDYPVGGLKLIYGTKGNYITVVNRLNKGKFSKQFTRKMKRKSVLKTKQFKGPQSLTGIDFSDHLNYWKMGYDACMLTDTAFYRNKNYHKKTDQMGTLNIPKMAQVIDGVFSALISL